MPATFPQLLTAREAAQMCRMSYEHFKDLQSRGETPAIGPVGRKGRRVLYTVPGLMHWLETRGTDARMKRRA